MKENKKENLQNNPTNKKKHGFLYYFLNVLFYSICGAVIAFAALNSIDRSTHYSFLPNHTAVIVSPSMSRIHEDNLSYLSEENTQHIQKNDVIYTTSYKSFDDIKLMDVAVYIGENGTMICHRVVEKYEDSDGQFIVTRGDANNSSDTPVNYSAVRGKVVWVIPKAGNFVNFTQSVYFVMAVCFSAFFVFLGMFIYNIQNDSKTPNLDEESEKSNTFTSEKIIVPETPEIEETSTNENSGEKNKEELTTINNTIDDA